jgi:hypothetical protein
METTVQPRDVRLTFKSGGWVLVIAAVFCLAILAWALAGPLLGLRPQGDGREASTYGFDLSTCLVDRASVYGSGRPRDFLVSLDHPMVLDGSRVEAHNEKLRAKEHLKHLVPGDRVVGVVLKGEARAYPVAVLNGHEIVNDVLAETPIAVTFSPLCDSPMVFERRVGEREVEFGISGLLHNGNLVMYDRSEGTTPSLWCQLQARAIAGPSAERGARLRVVPDVNLTTWAEWLARHPDTTVIDADPTRRRSYKEISYRRYLDSDELITPVTPMPEAEAPLTIKSRVVAVVHGEEALIVPLDVVLNAAQGVEREFAGRRIRFTRAAEPAGTSHPHIYVEMDEGEDAPTLVHCVWFAWQRVAMRDGMRVTIVTSADGP